jgi:hypothetical protein
MRATEYISCGVEHTYYIGILGNTINLNGFQITHVAPFLPEHGTTRHSFMVLAEREVPNLKRLAWKVIQRHAGQVEDAIEQQKLGGWRLETMSRKFSDLQGEKNVFLIFCQLIDDDVPSPPVDLPYSET